MDFDWDNEALKMPEGLRQTCFSDTPRIKEKPFSKRVGDNLLKRDKKGRVENYIGFYSESQTLARKVAAKAFLKCMQETFRL